MELIDLIFELIRTVWGFVFGIVEQSGIEEELLDYSVELLDLGVDLIDESEDD